jgi:6-phosphofructokinase
LYSAIGGGAHLALLPHSQPDLGELAAKVTQRSSTVIAVSEGYCRQEREKCDFVGSASDWLLHQLRQTGRLDEKQRRVVCEPFSRDIRGVSVNNSDLVLSQKFALLVAELAAEGKSHLMPTVLGSGSGSIPFSRVVTDNTVSVEDERLANRL